MTDPKKTLQFSVPAELYLRAGTERRIAFVGPLRWAEALEHLLGSPAEAATRERESNRAGPVRGALARWNERAAEDGESPADEREWTWRGVVIRASGGAVLSAEAEVGGGSSRLRLEMDAGALEGEAADAVRGALSMLQAYVRPRRMRRPR